MTLAKIGTNVYSTLADAAAAVVSGQTVSVVRNGELAEATAAFTKAGSFKILGVKDANGGIPKLHVDATIRPAWGKAILNLEDGSYEIGYLHLDGCMVPDSNGAGIRVNPTSDVVNLHHLRLTNNENGILSAEGTAQISVSDSVIDGNGKVSDLTRRGYSHNAYLGKNPLFAATRVSFTNSVYGHDLKSRALKTTLSQVLCEGSAHGRELDLPNGSILEATDCKFAKRSSAGQNNLIDIGAEGFADGRTESYTFTNCHFHNDVDPGRDVQYILNRSSKEVVLIDPLFTGAAAAKDRKSTLVGNIRIVLTGGPLGPRVPTGGDPGSTSTVPAPAPTPVGTPTPSVSTPPPPQIPGVDTAAWLNLLAALIGDADRNTTLTVTIKANPTDGLVSVAAKITHPLT